MERGDPLWYRSTRAGLRGYTVRRKGYFVRLRSDGLAVIYIVDERNNLTRLVVPPESLSPRDSTERHA